MKINEDDIKGFISYKVTEKLNSIIIMDYNSVLINGFQELCGFIYICLLFLDLSWSLVYYINTYMSPFNTYMSPLCKGLTELVCSEYVSWLVIIFLSEVIDLYMLILLVNKELTFIYCVLVIRELELENKPNKMHRISFFLLYKRLKLNIIL